MLTGIYLLNIPADSCFHFRQFNTWSCKQFNLISPTALYQYELPQAHCLLYMSVPDTRTAFNCCCSFNWKRRTDGNFELSNITSAVHIREFLGSRPGRFIPAETGQYIVTTRLCLKVLERRENTAIYRNSIPGIVQLRAWRADRLRGFLQEISSRKV